MNIAYTSSNEYAKFVGISIYSLLDNNKSVKNISIYIIDMGIDEDNKNKIKCIVAKYNRNIEFISAEKQIKELANHHKFDDFHGGINSYVKILPGLFLPKIDRVLFLDADTIIVCNLEEMYNKNLGDALIAAVPDVGVYFFGHEDYYIVKKNNIYYNTGVLLFDLDKVRKIKFHNVIFKAKDNYKGKLKLADQSLLNLAVNNNDVLTLNICYNNYIHSIKSDYFIGYIHQKNEDWFIKIVDEIIEARKKPVIVHYVRGLHLGGRPWLRWNTSHMSRYYLKYWRRSSWRHEKRGSNIKETRRLKRIQNPKTIMSKPIIGDVYAIIWIIVSKYSSKKTWELFQNILLIIKNKIGIITKTKTIHAILRKLLKSKRNRYYRSIQIFGMRLNIFSKKFALMEIKELDRKVLNKTNHN